MKKVQIILILCLLSSFNVFSQISIRDSVINTGMFSANYSYNIPIGDLAKRFGENSTVGGKFSYKTNKNWIFEFQGDFMFGGNVKETFGDSIRTSTGDIIDGNGAYADIRTFERGFTFFLRAGKIFPIIGPNKNSGITLTNGFGFMQHKIRIENPDNVTPQIAGDYKKGYDRLTNGFAMNQFIGYTHFGNNRLYSFYIGLEITEAWTKNRRSFNFDTKTADNTSRFDGTCGLKFGWIFPLYKKVPHQYYYN